MTMSGVSINNEGIVHILLYWSCVCVLGGGGGGSVRVCMNE